VGIHRTRIASVLAILALLAPAPAAALAQPTPSAHVAKTCSRGFKHAVIHGKEKCLRRGEFCTRRYQHDYQRYGYSCSKRDRNGRYHLQ
jgi:hypothetical protein